MLLMSDIIEGRGLRSGRRTFAREWRVSGGRSRGCERIHLLPRCGILQHALSGVKLEEVPANAGVNCTEAVEYLWLWTGIGIALENTAAGAT